MGWFVWYGLKMGLSYQETLDLPYGELSDLVAIEQIKNEGAKLKAADYEEQDEFFDLLSWR